MRLPGQADGLLSDEVTGLGLAQEGGLTVIAQAATGREAVEQYFAHVPDIAIIDMRLPDVDGIEVITSIRARYPQAKTVILTTAIGDVQIVRAFRAGAYSYLLKSMVRRELTETILLVARGQKRIPQEIALSRWMPIRYPG